MRQIIGNDIAAGEAKEMNVLTKELMPYIQQNYSVLTGQIGRAHV